MKRSKVTTAKTLSGELTAQFHICNTKTKVVSEQLEYSFVFNFKTDEIIKECLFMNMTFGVFDI